MKSQSRSLVLFLIVVSPTLVFPQALLLFPEGLGLEIGGGYNQLFWHVRAIQNVSPDADNSRKEFSITPTIRIRYEFSPILDMQIQPFVGYNEFGGKSATYTDGYKDEYWIHAIELGIVAAAVLGDFRLGVGIKHNRYLSVFHRYYGTLLQTAPRSWQEENETTFLKKYSSSLGPRISYILSHWSMSAEAWFGITDLQKDDFDEILSIRENHYRILLAITI